MVHQNHRGEFLAARTEHMPGPQEALCCRVALRWSRNMGVCRVVLESDSQFLVNAVHGYAKYLLSVGSMIRDCKELFRDILEVSLVFVRRSTKWVAHTLARAAGSMFDLEVWDANPPGFIRAVMFSDIE